MKTLNQILRELETLTSYSPFEEHPIFKIWGSIPKKNYLFTRELIDKLSYSLNSKNEDAIYDLILISDIDGVDKKFTDIFCQLLKVDWYQSGEDIVSLLEEIKDPKSIDTLYETALNFPDYDDARALTKKCIWALDAINTKEAKEKLSLLAHSDDPIIKEFALMRLNHKR